MTSEIAAAPLGSRVAESLRTGLPGNVVFALVIGTAVFFETPVAALIVILWKFAARTPWRDLGLVRPKGWPRLIALGVALGLVEKLVMKAVVLPLLGAPATNAAFAHVAHDSPQKLLFLFAYVLIGASFCEELVFRGYFFERFTKATGDGWPQRIFIVLFGAAFFGALHYYPQGLSGVENAAIGGLIAGAIYVLNGRQLWLLVVMHATFDLAAFAMIYFGWETAVSHLVFP